MAQTEAGGEKNSTYRSCASSWKAEKSGSSIGLVMGRTVGPAALSCLVKAAWGIGLADSR